jgi:hypothetical protein
MNGEMNRVSSCPSLPTCKSSIHRGIDFHFCHYGTTRQGKAFRQSPAADRQTISEKLSSNRGLKWNADTIIASHDLRPSETLDKDVRLYTPVGHEIMKVSSGGSQNNQPFHVVGRHSVVCCSVAMCVSYGILLMCFVYETIDECQCQKM